MIPPELGVMVSALFTASHQIVALILEKMSSILLLFKELCHESSREIKTNRF